MTTFVLVHGAWQGGWVWDRVAVRLRAEGHEVLTPTLTGLGERAGELTPEVSLATHVTDVVAALDRLRPPVRAVLVGHSYGGQVIAGVASLRPHAIARLIYLDAFIPDDGQSANEEQPPEIAQIYRDSVVDGWLLPPRSLKALGVTDPDDVVLFESRMVMHPWRTFIEPATVTPESLAFPSAFVECVGGIGVFSGQRRKAEARGWPVHELPTGHQAMTTMPAELTALLFELVR